MKHLAVRKFALGRRIAVLAACFAAIAWPTDGSASETRRSAVVRAVEAAGPCVVNIQGEKTVNDVGETGGEPVRHVNGMGSGVIIDARGYIITNHHVVDGVSEIQTTLSNGESYVARIVARDAATDLAVIKIDAPGELPVISLGTSSDLMTGESVIAVGNPFGYQNTVTRGIISALHRPVQISDDQRYENLIQTDASINPGNSGGPLLNIDGQMIGINVAVRANAQGIGFAIPIDEAMQIATGMLSARRLAGLWHGLTWGSSPTAPDSGVQVAAAEAKSPAEKAGFLQGDVIVAVGQSAVHRPLDFERSLWSHKAGDAIEVSLERGGECMTLTLALEKAPAAENEDDPIWARLGLRLSPMPAAEFRRLGSKYKGGLNVLAVRKGSAADERNLRVGDVLVGLHKWSTLSIEDVEFAIDSPEATQLGPIPFYVLRGRKTYTGQLRVAR